MKPRKCKSCGACFERQRAMQSVCSPMCAADLARAKKEQAERKQARAKREQLKTRSDWIKEAQVAVNKFVRLRDAGRGCISCGCSLSDGGTGGGADAGHYRSRGSSPHLRFEVNNIHAQCKRCNRYLAGNAIEFRAGLVVRYGSEYVEALEADQEPRMYGIPELRTIRDTYRALARELEKANA